MTLKVSQAAADDLEGIWLSLEEGIADASGLVIRRVPLRRVHAPP